MKQLFCLLFLLISVIARTQTTAQWVSSSATQQWTKETALHSALQNKKQMP